MNILVFDTETIGIEKCYCYDLGYKIVNIETHETLVKREFIIEQIWNNRLFFDTAYYAEKRPLYTSKLRGRKAVLKKWGFAIGQMIRDIEQYNAKSFYAYNSNFDSKVFEFNATNYNTRNALDYGAVFDIWGYTSELIKSGKANDYIEFCKQNEYFTACGNIMNNADTWGKFFNGVEWNEEHTALEDSEIECRILLECFNRGLAVDTNYKVVKQIKIEGCLPKERQLIINYNGEKITYKYHRKTEFKKTDTIKLEHYED